MRSVVRAVTAAMAVLAGVVAGVVALAGLAGLAVLSSVATAPAASAHGPASTLVTVRLAQASTPTSGPVVRLVAKVPLQELDAAYDTTLADEAARDGAGRAIAEHRSELSALFAERVGLTSSDGTPWAVEVGSVAAGSDQGQDAVRVVLRGAAPTPGSGAAGSGSAVDLTWGVVTDVVVTHQVYVGAVGASGQTTLVATLTREHPTTTLRVDDPGAAGAGPSTGTTLWSVGWHHFREGADHLLFLSLVALGVARRRDRWTTTAKRLGLLTLVFTLGHSLSLGLATLGWVALPSRWVEVAIAATILLAVAHVVRPTLSRRAEVAVTGAFGLIHGFGFAGTLEELSLSGRELVAPLLTFNLGLEAAQLAALLLVVVPLLVLARSVTATRLLAGAVGVVALSWIVERATAAANPLEPVLGVVLASPERLALLLAVAAAPVLARTVRRRGRTGSAPSAPLRVGSDVAAPAVIG